MNQNKLLIPFSIVIAAALIGGAIIYTRTLPAPVEQTATVATSQQDTIKVPAVHDKDHIQGSRDAKVFLIEYSDTECPFCKQFQRSLSSIIDTYGAQNTVAWVYRHFPIPQLHPSAPKEAEATECVAELGGETKFWDYLDLIYRTTPGNNGLDPAELPIMAGKVGVDVTAFKTCLSSGKYTEFITNSFNEARSLGAQGTPFTVIVTKEPVTKIQIQQLQDLFIAAATQLKVTPERIGSVMKDGKVTLNGAIPVEIVKQIIAILLS